MRGENKYSGSRACYIALLVLMIFVPAFPARASDGVMPTWSKYAGNPILGISTPEANVEFCSVFLDGSTYQMYYSYTTTTHPELMIGHATSTDKVTWTKDTAHNPVLDFEACYCPIAWKEGSSYRMLFTAHSAYGGGIEVLYANSTDGLVWTIQNNQHGVLNGTAGQWDTSGGGVFSDVEGWGLIKIGSTYYLWYDTLSNVPRKTGLATSTDLISWSKDGNNPIFIDASINYYCCSPFYFNGYYYLLISGSSSSGIELYRDSNPTFYSADRTHLGTAIAFGPDGSWDSTLLDTPFILTDDITRVISPSTTVYTYYTGTNEEVAPVLIGLTVMPSIEQSLPDSSPDYSISASPSALTIVAGSSGGSTVTVTSLNGFSDTVSLTSSAPSGWSATVTPSSVTGGSGSSALSITVPSATAAGTYTVTVAATSGSLNHSATVSVNVQTMPSSPLSLGATAGNAQVTLTWFVPSSNGGSAITNYNIYRGTASGGETLLTTLGNVLAYTDTAVTNGQTYYYQVTAVNSIGESSRSNEASATPFAATVGYFGNTNIGSSDDSAPNSYIVGGKYSPTSSGTVTQISFYVRLDASGHVKVAVYSDANGVPNALLSQSNPVAVGTSFTWVNFSINQAVVGGTNYWLCWITDTSVFRFKENAGSTNQEACCSDSTYPTFPNTFPSPGYHNLAPSIYATVSYVPSPDYSVSASPSALTIVAGSSGGSTVTVTSLNGFSDTVSLTSSAPSGWSATVTPSSVTGGSGSSALSITVPSAAAAGAYIVTVTGTSGSLIHSTTVTVNVQTMPSSPLSLGATAGNAQVTLTWSAPLSDGGSTITNYRIYRSIVSGAEKLLTTIGNVLAYTDSVVTNNQTYYYEVSAVNSIGESGLSNEANATPSASNPQTFTFGKTSVGSNSDSTGGSEYVVFCKYTMPESGSITKVTAYIQSFDGTPHNGKAALYADNAGVPGAKLVESSEVSISSLGWYNFTVSYTNTQGGRNFWLAITVQNGWRYRYDAGSSNQEAYRSYTYPNFPDPSSPGGYHAFAMSIYATYTPDT